MKQHTPIEIHSTIPPEKGFETSVMVKREDLSFAPPCPPFSKMRGLWEHMSKLKQEGIQTVGYTETSISMAGWGVAWAGKKLGMEVVIFDPQYKESPEILKKHRIQWKKLGAKTIPIPAGRGSVNYYIGKKILKEKFPRNSVILPLGLPLQETIEQTCEEYMKTSFENPPSTVVVSVGSGTIGAGILKAIKESSALLIGVMCRTGNISQKHKKICQKAQVIYQGFMKPSCSFHLIDEGWEYADKSEWACPFPCHPYYDLKGWEWLCKNIHLLEPPVLFWNIGSEIQ